LRQQIIQATEYGRAIHMWLYSSVANTQSNNQGSTLTCSLLDLIGKTSMHAVTLTSQLKELLYSRFKIIETRLGAPKSMMNRMIVKAKQKITSAIINDEIVNSVASPEFSARGHGRSDVTMVYGAISR
jgi:hypothetical protein